MFNPLSSPFEAFYADVAKRIEKTPPHLRNTLPYSTRSILDRKIVILELDYFTIAERKIAGSAQAWIYHEPGWFSEDWKIQNMSNETSTVEVISRTDRYRIYDLFNGVEVPSGTGEYFLKLSAKMLNAPHN